MQVHTSAQLMAVQDHLFAPSLSEAQPALTPNSTVQPPCAMAADCSKLRRHNAAVVGCGVSAE